MNTKENPWETDLLNRSNVADFIYSVVKTNDLSNGDDNALIFSIDGEWGSGKTHFINCWMKDLSSKGHPVLRFDAWEHDLSEEPFVALMSEFKKAIPEWTDKITIDKIAVNSIKEKSSELLKSAASAFIPSVKQLITHQVKKYAGDEFLEIINGGENQDENDEKSPNLTKDSLKIIEKEFKNQLDSHQIRQKSITALKENLSQISSLLSKEENISSPIFIFIDELDRCRPLYAIKLLETLKHIFNAEGFCFVVATDQSQLCESIKAVYGSGFNSRMYLKRFFSFDFTLPAPRRLDFIKILSKNLDENFTFNEFNHLPLLEIVNNEQPRTHISFAYIFDKIASSFDLSLRSIRQVYNRYTIINNLYRNKSQHETLQNTFLIWCLCLAHIDNDDFIKFKNNQKSEYFELSRKINFAYYYDGYVSREMIMVSLYEIINTYNSLRKRKASHTEVKDGWNSNIYRYSFTGISPSYDDYIDLSLMTLNYKI